MIILDTNGKITTNQNKTNIAIPFFVDSNTEKIIIDYFYSPKTVEDGEALVTQCLSEYQVESDNIDRFLPVKNLVTLSFDDPDGYRGACHRQANQQQIIIANSDSTYGIINRPTISGNWQIMLNVHYVGCEVEYKLKVTGVEK